MPLFFFHSQTDRRCSDNEGSELDDIVAARTEASMFFGELIRHTTLRGKEPMRRWGVTVTNASGLVMHEVYLDPVVQRVGI